MNGLPLALALLTAVEPDCCFLGPGHFDPFAHLPPLSDAERFSCTRSHASSQVQIHDHWLKEGDPAAPYCALYREKSRRRAALLRWNRDTWDCLDDALFAPDGEEPRRAALRRLRLRIGLEAYERGEMPPRLRWGESPWE